MASRRSARRARRSAANATGQGPDSSTPAGSNGARSRAAGSQRRSSRGGAADAAGGHRPPIDRDGKASISCPTCAARYRIPEEHLESKVTCTQCHRTFYPLASLGARRQRPDNSKPIIYGIIAVAAIIVIGVIINSVTTPPPPASETNATKEQSIDLSATKEVTAVIAWALAIGDKDHFNAKGRTDIDAMQKLLSIEPKNKFSLAFGPAKDELETKVLDALFVADDTLVYRFYKPTYGRVEDAAMLDKRAGTVNLSLYPRDSKIHKESATVRVHYRLDNSDTVRVTGWNVVQMARADYLAEAVDGKASGKKTSRHKLIGASTKREITFGGEKMKIEEAELVPLPHLETTSEADRKTIDGLIEKIVDINASGMHFNRADLALQKFDKAAVPRLLNKMYETKMKTHEDVLVLNRLCRTLRHISGERFGFNPADGKPGSDIGGTEAERVSALKQWYAWWARYHDRDDWKNEDREDELELNTEQIKAKRAAEREQARKEREERAKRARGK